MVLAHKPEQIDHGSWQRLSMLKVSRGLVPYRLVTLDLSARVISMHGVVGVTSDPLTCVRRAVWGMLYADEAGMVSKSAEGLAKRMTVIVTVFEAAGLTVSED